MPKIIPIEEKRAKALEVIDRVHAGAGIAKSCEAVGIGYKEFTEFVLSVPVLSLQYASARKSRADLYADEILDIADNEPDPQKARNRIDARKWLAAKMDPHQYSERIDLNVGGTIDIIGALAEGKRRAGILTSDSGNTIDVEPIVTKQLSLVPDTGAPPVTPAQPIETKGDTDNDLPNPMD
jgi:hypothetical protein